jgi:hypothetical protein
VLFFIPLVIFVILYIIQGAGGVAQMVECLSSKPSKHEGPEFKPQYHKKKERRKQTKTEKKRRKNRKNILFFISKRNLVDR